MFIINYAVLSIPTNSTKYNYKQFFLTGIYGCIFLLCLDIKLLKFHQILLFFVRSTATLAIKVSKRLHTHKDDDLQEKVAVTCYLCDLCCTDVDL